MQTTQIPVACFAPPLTDAKLADYRTLVNDVDDAELKDALETCLRCVEAWWDIPESKRTDGARLATMHRGAIRAYQVVPLEDAQVKSLWDSTPWMTELLAYEQLCDAIQDRPLRDCAFHLLWHAKEITLDREPLTADKL